MHTDAFCFGDLEIALYQNGNLALNYIEIITAIAWLKLINIIVIVTEKMQLN